MRDSGASISQEAVLKGVPEETGDTLAVLYLKFTKFGKVVKKI